jgi:hypothetical protein
VTDLKLLTPDEILAADDRPVATLEVPEWGGSIRVRALSLDDYLGLKEKHMIDGNTDERGLSTAMLQAGIVGEDGESCFTIDQARLLLDKSAVPLGRVMKAIGQVTGADAETAKVAAATFRPSSES